MINKRFWIIVLCAVRENVDGLVYLVLTCFVRMCTEF